MFFLQYVDASLVHASIYQTLPEQYSEMSPRANNNELPVSPSHRLVMLHYSLLAFTALPLVSTL